MQAHKKLATFASATTPVIVVGVQRNTAAVAQWEDFANFFSSQTAQWLKDGDISAKTKAITKIPYAGDNASVKRVIFVGLGDAKELTEKTLREAFGLVGKELQKLRATAYTLYVESFATDKIEAEDVVYLAAEGVAMGYYTVENYKTKQKNIADVALENVEFIANGDADALVAGYEIGDIYAKATNSARGLINMPPNLLVASKLADYAEELAKKYGFEIEVLKKAELEEIGMGGILGVNRGSVEEPRLITIKYKGTEQWEDVVGLVGKGITYDTGGYSIKSKTGMVGMKGDMGGAAAVLGAMQIVGELQPKQNVMAVIASTDNMISGEAIKPDDILTMYDGTTVEVLNTDAEGRLVLADAVSYAKAQGANYLIDLATLTGGVITALGFDKTGALANDEAFFEEFMEATGETDEFVWRLPLTESDKKRIRTSDIADLNNSPGSDGHMIFGGGFVGEFVGDTPWIHLDIAGTSDASAAYDLGPKGGTGVMVRTLASFIERKSAQ